MAEAPNYDALYEAAGKQWNVDPRRLKAIMRVESGEGTDPNSRSPNSSGAQGIAQFIPGTAAQYHVDVNDPASSINGAAHYLSDLLDQNKGDLNLALSHYGNDMDGHKGYANAVNAAYDQLPSAANAPAPAPPSDQTAAPPIVDMTKQAGFGDRFGPLQGVNGMIIHHTGGGRSVDDVLHTFQQRGFPAQYVIGRDGTIYQTLPDGTQGRQIMTGAGEGTGLSNANTIGVEVIANDNNDVNDAQVQAGQQLVNYLGPKYGFNPYTQVYGHGEVNPGHKEPSEGMKIVNAQRQAAATGPQPPAPGTVPGPTIPPDQQAYRGGLPPDVKFNTQGVPYNLYLVGAGGAPAGVTIPAAPSPGVTVETAPGVETAQAAGDFSHLVAPPPTASATQGPTMAQKPADDDFSHLIAPAPSASAAPAAAVSDPEIYPTPVPAGSPGYAPPSVSAGGPAPNWWQRNIADPVSAMWNPTPAAQQPSQNYLLGSPLAQSIGAGFLQGPRDVAQTVTGWARDADKNYPWLANIDQAARNILPSSVPLVGGADSARTNQNLAAASAANEQQYGSSIPYQAARVAGDIAATAYPAGWAARGAGAVGRLVPGIGRIVGGAGEGAVAGGLQNMLTSPDQDFRTSFGYGAAGGAGIGGLFGMFGGRAASPVADRLGIDLSRGQTGGALARRIEDTTAPFPGSGAAPFAQQQRQQIADVIAREAGMPEGQPITSGALNQAERRVGSSIETAAQNITVPGNPLFANLPAIESAAVQAGPNTPQAHTFRNLSDQLLNLVSNNGGALPGDQFAQFIARGGPLDIARNSSVPEVRAVGNQIREALLDAGQQGTPQTAQALQDLSNARYQWKVLQTVRPAIDRTAGGSEEMSLPGLANSIRGNFDPRLGGNMHDLGQLISGPLRTLPSSGTAERSLWQQLLSGGLELGGAGAAGASLLGAAPAAGALGLGAFAPAVIGRASRFGPGLGNPLIGAAREVYNPLVPRMVGPALGQNWLAAQPQPATP